MLNALEAREFDVVLMDLNYTRDTTSGQEGLDLLSRIQAIDSTLPVVVMTAWGSVEDRGGSHAARRARFHPEAVGKRAADQPSCARRSS